MGIVAGLTAVIASLLPSIGPISLAAGAGFGIATGTFAIAQAIATVAVVGGLIALNYALTPHPQQQQIDPGKLKETFTANDSPEVRAVGRVRVGGLQAFGDTTGSLRFRLILHCKGTVDAVETYFVGNHEVIVDSDGAVSSPPWPRDGGSYLYLYTDLGDPNKTAWQLLIDNFPGVWTSDYRARGIAQTLAEYVSPGLGNEKFAQLYQGGVPPVEVVMRAEDTVYDPRTATSAWSENGVCNALHILRSYPELSDLSIYDLDFLASEANRADVLTARYNGGSTKRARCWGFWTSELNRGDAMQQVLDSVGAWIVPRSSGSKIGVQLIDDDPTAEITIAQRDILDITWNAGPQAVERPNVCRVSYYSPERDYEMTDIDLTGIAWARIDSEITANGEKPLDIKLPFCPDAGQAQQIARRKFALARADSGIMHTNFAGMAALGCRVINIEFPDDLGTIKCLVGVPRILDDEGKVEIPFVVWPTLMAWNVATDEAPPPDEIPNLTVATLTQPTQPSAATKITYPDTSIVTRVGYAIPNDVFADVRSGAATIEAVYRTYTNGLPNAWQPMTEYLAPAPSTAAHAYVAGDLSGQVVDFRVRTFDGVNSSNWSPLFNVAVPATNTAPTVPTITVTNNAADHTATITATAPDDLDVAYMEFTGNDAPVGSINTEPGQITIWTTDTTQTQNDYTLTFTAKALASDGTMSAIASVDITISGTGV